MKIKPKDYDRRELFKMLGGSALLLHPILSSREGYGADGAAAKKRFLAFLTSSGVIQANFWPKGTAAKYDLTGTSLEPLNDFKKDLTIVKGVRVEQGPFDAHSGGSINLFTGDWINRAACGKDGCDYTTGEVIARGPSTDQIFVGSIKGKTQVPSLVLSILPARERWSKYCSFTNEGRRTAPETNPYALFDTLFKDLTANCSGGPDSGTLTPSMKIRRKSILDAVNGDLKAAMKHSGLDAEEKAKLDSYASGIRDIEKKLESTMVASDAACKTLSKFVMDPRVPVKPDNYTVIGRLMMDLIVAAFQMDITRSVTLMWSVGGVQGVASNWAKFNNMPIKESYHSLTHGQVDPVSWKEKCAILDKWHAGEYAYLLGKLRDMKEGDASVLDNSLAIWTSELGDGFSHGDSDVPTVIAGSAGKALKTGRYVQAGKVMHQGLLLDILQVLGVNKTKIGRAGENPKRFIT